MTPNDLQRLTSISKKILQVPWVFFHILIEQGMYIWNIKIINSITSALILFFIRVKKQIDGQRDKNIFKNHEIFIPDTSLTYAQPLQKILLKSIVYFEKYGSFTFLPWPLSMTERDLATSISQKPVKFRKRYLAFLQSI